MVYYRKNKTFRTKEVYATVVWLICTTSHFYRPQRSCGKVMFSEASVILFTGGGRHPSPGRHPALPSTCWDRNPPAQCMLGYSPSPHGHCSGRCASYWNAFLYCDYLHSPTHRPISVSLHGYHMFCFGEHSVNPATALHRFFECIFSWKSNCRHIIIHICRKQ